MWRMEQVTDLRRRIRDFVADQVIPAEDALDTGDVRRLAELRTLATESGLWALPLDVEHGGAGLPLADYLRVAEAEGRSDHGPDALGSGSLLNVRMLARHAAAELRDRLLPGLVSGTLHAAYAMTEPGVAGSDPAALRTTAERGADGWWTITGRKWFTTGADRADVITVLARTAPTGPARTSFSLLAVPTDAAGFHVVRELDVLGAGGQHEIAFDGVRVPAANLLGEPGAGMTIAGERLALGRTLRALRWIGQAQRALELLAARAGSRRIGHGTLGDQQLVQRMVFDAELQVRSARALAADAAALVAAEQPCVVEVGLAKVAAARAITEAVDAAIQAHGAEGLTAATGLPRLLRVARTARILDGADELHITSTARRLLRHYAADGTD